MHFSSAFYVFSLLLFSEHVSSMEPMVPSISLVTPTNTGVKHIGFKNVQCGESGYWQLEIINNAFAESNIEYFFWLEDVEGDPLESHAGVVRIDPKSREQVSLLFPCETAFTRLKHHFQMAPLGFTQQ